MQVLIKGKTHLLQLVGHVADFHLNLIVNHGLRYFDIGDLGQFCQGIVLTTIEVALFCFFLQILADGVTIFFHGVIFGDILRKIIVGFRNILLLHFMQHNRKHGIFAGQIFGMIFLRERDVHVKALARFVTDNLFFKAGNKRTGAQFQLLLFCGAAFKSNTIHASGIINLYRITLFCSTFYRTYDGVFLLF